MGSDFDFDDSPPEQVAGFRLRDYQFEWAGNIDRDRAAGLTRLLIDASGGLGKSTLFAFLALQEWQRYGRRTLVLANRDRLVRQSAARMARETGLEVAIEMGNEHASPFAPIVMASIQTLGRINRLTGFADDHFALVVPDEAHHSLSDQFQRVLNYFHYGAESLAPTWIRPPDGEYRPKATIVGTTATPPAVGKKNHLGQFFQKYSARYSYLKAVQQGWLVRPVMKNIPVKIDLRKAKLGGTSHGQDFKDRDITALMIPIIEQLADQIVLEASDRKTMCFLPSVECARLMAAAIQRRGLNSIFVSGECIDADEKATAFDQAPMGTVMSLCSIYVEGIDFPTVNCIAWFRPTVSEEWYKQGIFRGTRTLPGTVDDSMTAEERCAAIEASAKPDLLILDPLYNSDRIDLCTAHDLYTDKKEVANLMRKLPGMSLEAAAEKAERDYLASLEKAARLAKNKAARTIDPLAFAVAINDEKLASYVPQEPWEDGPPTEVQMKLLADLKWPDPTKIKTSGLAQKMISILLMRREEKLATPGQMQFLAQLGYHDAQMATWSAAKAGFMISRGPVRSAPQAAVSAPQTRARDLSDLAF